MTSQSSKQLLVGLPSAGKTTFTAALFHVVEAGTLPESLTLHELEDDTQYLHAISSAWLGCQEMERTETGFHSLISMKLKEPRSKLEPEQVTELLFPDVGGERFRQQWEDRECEPAYAELVKGITGLLLFVHPDNVTEPKTIREVDALLDDEDEGQSELQKIGEEEEESEEESVAWAASYAPTQVQLVELLQFILNLKGIEASSPGAFLRVAVIISAWDVVEQADKVPKLQQTPAQWLAENLPLLDQFLKANWQHFRCSIYGVSAQGGDIKSAEQVGHLQSQHNSAERIRVLHEDKESHDITQPIRWVMG